MKVLIKIEGRYKNFDDNDKYTQHQPNIITSLEEGVI